VGGGGTAKPTGADQAQSRIGEAAAKPQYGPVTFFWWGSRKVRGADQGLVLLALLAGILGSFMHAAQSLSAFVGNRQLRASWTLWYVLRPPIGAILGALFYFFCAPD
jgi:hypothetical protein